MSIGALTWWSYEIIFSGSTWFLNVKLDRIIKLIAAV